MKTKISIYLLALAVSWIVSGCADDFIQIDSQNQNFEEGELIEATISLEVSNFTVDAPKSRAEDPTTADPDTYDEKRIDNFWVFQYNATTGDKLINPRYYTVTNQSKLTELKVFLKNGIASKICIVTNTSDPNWINSGGNFDKYSDLIKETIPNPEPQFSDSVSIPMWGEKKATVDYTKVVEIKVERMFARLDIMVESLVGTLSLDAIEINNISWYCQVSSRFINDATAADYSRVPDTTYAWITRSWVEDSLPKKSEGGYDYVSIYVPENIQGENNNVLSSSYKYKNAPKKAMKVGFHVTYTEPETNAESAYTYYVNPGGNYYNYNVRRNCVYAVTIDVQHDDSARHTPSSNCIVVKPGKTVAFEPYFRVETGGGYNFKDYLDENDTIEKKKLINDVEIIWQSTWKVTTDVKASGGTADDTVFGDNTLGDKVWYNHANKKIYVKSRNQGNALIAARNSKGDIIWSWHIWSTNLDPQNVGDAIVYTTYAWDNTGTHFKNKRVPGYAVMKCNLGALAAEPGDEDDWFQTWGMYYQWGRKDPFPPAWTTKSNIDWTACDAYWGSPDGRPPGRTHSYEPRFVTALYDNSNERITGITEKEWSSDELFYTYSVWKSDCTLSSATEGINYSIEHPTVFMAGDAEPGKVYDLTTVTGIYACEDCNVETGDWLPLPANKLWGGSEPDETSKYLKIPGAAYNTIYDNYGTEKSIFDPCPTGWRVPPDNLWMSFTSTGLNPFPIGATYGDPKMAEDVNFDNNYKFTFIEKNLSPGIWMYMQDWKAGRKLFFPTQGVRRPRGHITRVMMCGSYLSANVGQPITDSSTGGNWVNCLHMHYPYATYWNRLYFMVFEYANSIFRSKSTAGSVRCVRDTY